MDKFEIIPSKILPNICLDPGEGNFSISGRSIPSNPSEVFTPVISWLEKYKENPNEQTTFVFSLEYFNTATHKYISNVVAVLKQIANITVQWKYFEDDEDLLDIGKRLSDYYELPFEFVIIS